MGAAVVDACGVHLLPDAAVVQEIFFDLVNHLAEHRDGLVNQREHKVAKGFVVHSGCKDCIVGGSIVCAAESQKLAITRIVFLSKCDAASAHIIFVVVEQLMQAAASHAKEPDFHLG